MAKRILTILMVLCSLVVTAENYPYRSDYLWVTVPNHADWLYRCGEQASIEVQLYEYGMPVNGVVNVAVYPDMLSQTTATSVLLQNGKGHMTLPGRKTPGFTELVFTLGDDQQAPKHHIKVGYDAEKIQPWTKEPKDFTSYWQQAISDNHKVAPEVMLQQDAPEYSTAQVRCQLIQLRVDKKHSIYAYIFIPRDAQQGSCPAVLCPPGAGIKTIKNPERHRYYAESGCIRMEMEIHGFDPRMTEREFKEITAAFNPTNQTGYLANGLQDKDSYYMRHVYLSLIRAIDYLCTLPEWDGKNMILQGGSQGGALSLVAAALDSRVTACVANHPALTDMAAYSAQNTTGGYPHFSPEQAKAHAEVLAYYDVINFCRHITCPVYMTWGYCDSTCPPTTSWAAYNTLTCKKESLITPINEHWVSDRTEHTQLDWIRNNLK